MEIRALNEGDVGTFQALRLSALRDRPSAFGSSFDEECDIPIEAISERIAGTPGRCLFGAFDQSDLAGCIGLQRETGLRHAHKAHICGMYVAPLHRNKGIGRALIVNVLDFAAAMPGLRNITLSVTQGNSAAAMLYEKVGFTTFGVEPDARLIDDQLHDEIHMCRSAMARPDNPFQPKRLRGSA